MIPAPRGVAIRAAGVALAVALACAAGCRPPVKSNGYNVLLVTFETTRADHLGLYGYARATSPELDRFGSDAVTFETAISASPRTNPSLASLMTGDYPHEHGVRNLLLPLDPENRTLAEALRDSGYRTGAVQTHPRLVRGSGFEQGFDDYDDAVAAHPLADQAVDVARRWIDRQRNRDRPWFLWLHLMDPHWTYDPPAGARTPFGAEHPLPAETYRAVREGRVRVGDLIHRNEMTPDELQGFVDLYDAEILYTDRAFGDLLRSLEASGDLERTVVAVTADHGESLGENDYFFEHGDYGGQAEIHVPLVLDAPGLAGERVPASVRTIDVAPTILELVDAPPTSRLAAAGHSLTSLFGAAGTRTADRSCFGETGRRFHEQNVTRQVDGVRGKWRFLVRGPFKLMHRPLRGGAVERSLYRLDGSGGEEVDVAASYPDVARRLGAEMDALLAEDTDPVRDYRISDEAREVLKSLGYVD